MSPCENAAYTFADEHRCMQTHTHTCAWSCVGLIYVRAAHIYQKFSVEPFELQEVLPSEVSNPALCDKRSLFYLVASANAVHYDWMPSLYLSCTCLKKKRRRKPISLETQMRSSVSRVQNCVFCSEIAQPWPVSGANCASVEAALVKKKRKKV